MDKQPALQVVDQGGFEGCCEEASFDKAAGRCSILWNDLPWKFEAGTPNICGGIGLMAAVQYLKGIGMENVKAHEHTLTEYALKLLKDCQHITVYGPEETSARSGIISFNVNGANSHDTALFLDSYGIMVRSGFHCAQPLHQRLNSQSSVRASFYIYKVKEEIDVFVDALKKIGQI